MPERSFYLSKLRPVSHISREADSTIFAMLFYQIWTHFSKQTKPLRLLHKRAWRVARSAVLILLQITAFWHVTLCRVVPAVKRDRTRSYHYSSERRQPLAQRHRVTSQKASSSRSVLANFNPQGGHIIRWTRLRVAHVYTYIEGGGGDWIN
jgi:hypothetical protein